MTYKLILGVLWLILGVVSLIGAIYLKDNSGVIVASVLLTGSMILHYLPEKKDGD